MKNSTTVEACLEKVSDYLKEADAGYLDPLISPDGVCKLLNAAFGSTICREIKLNPSIAKYGLFSKLLEQHGFKLKPGTERVFTKV